MGVRWLHSGRRTRHRVGRIVSAGVLLLGLASTGYAVDPPYLDAWPSVDRVLADNLGADTDDTMARQMAALNVFNASIEYKVLATFSRWLAGGADARWS